MNIPSGKRNEVNEQKKLTDKGNKFPENQLAFYLSVIQFLLPKHCHKQNESTSNLRDYWVHYSHSIVLGGLLVTS